MKTVILDWILFAIKDFIRKMVKWGSIFFNLMVLLWLCTRMSFLENTKVFWDDVALVCKIILNGSEKSISLYYSYNFLCIWGCFKIKVKKMYIVLISNTELDSNQDQMFSHGVHSSLFRCWSLESSCFYPGATWCYFSFGFIKIWNHPELCCQWLSFTPL